MLERAYSSKNPLRKDQIWTGWTHRAASAAPLQLVASLTWYLYACPFWENRNQPTARKCHYLQEKEDLLGSRSDSRPQKEECIHYSTCKCYSPESQIWKQMGSKTNLFFILFLFILFHCIFLVWLRHVVCGISVPRPGIEPMPPTVEAPCPNH